MKTLLTLLVLSFFIVSVYAQQPLDIEHSAEVAIDIKSTSGASFIDIDGFSGESGLRLYENGVSKWGFGIEPGDDDFHFMDLSSSSEIFRVIPVSGRVGFNISIPNAQVDVGGTSGPLENGFGITNTSVASSWKLYSSSSGNMFIGKSSQLGSFDGTTGAYSATSDGRLKTNIRSLEAVLGSLMQLDAKRYEFKFNNPEKSQSIGFIAQDIRELFPEFVSENSGDDGSPLVSNQLMLDYSGLSVLAIKAIQEQQAQIEDLKKENILLKAQVESILQKIDDLDRK